jgi:hypothetical protein
MTQDDLTQALLAAFKTPRADGQPRTRDELEQALPLVFISIAKRHGVDKVPDHMRPLFNNLCQALAIPLEPGDAQDAALATALDGLQGQYDPTLLAALDQAFDAALLSAEAA